MIPIFIMNLHVLENIVNEELKKLSLWLNVNRLALNIGKTNFVIFHTTNKKLPYNVTLQLNRKAILQKEHIKYLGVTVDQHLSWKEHISNVSKTISRNTGILCKLRTYLNPKLLKTIYYSLIYSYIIYGIQVWGSAGITLLDKVLIVQKRAVRIMTNNSHYASARPLASSTPLFKELKILKLQDVYNLHVATFIYSCLSLATPSIFFDWFIINNSMHSHATTTNTIITQEHYFDVGEASSTNCLHNRYSRLVTYGGKLLKVVGPIVWNSLPPYVRDSPSLFSFKLELKNYLLNQYN